MKANAESMRRFLQVLPLLRGRREGRVKHNGNNACLWHEFAQKLEPLGLKGTGQIAYAGQIASWSVEACDEPGGDRIRSENCNNGYGRSCSLIPFLHQSELTI